MVTFIFFREFISSKKWTFCKLWFGWLCFVHKEFWSFLWPSYV